MDRTYFQIGILSTTDNFIHCQMKDNLNSIHLVRHHLIRISATVSSKICMNQISTLDNLVNIPGLILDDLNETESPKERLSDHQAKSTRSIKFNSFIQKIGLMDIGNSGSLYTWYNKRETTDPTFEQLDRVLRNY